MEEATPADHASSGHAGQSGSSKAHPPSCLASIPSFISFEPAPLGSPSAPTWHSVPTSIIHCGRCEGGERRV